jgi:hypothetical protein
VRFLLQLAAGALRAWRGHCHEQRLAAADLQRSAFQAWRGLRRGLGGGRREPRGGKEQLLRGLPPCAPGPAAAAAAADLQPAETAKDRGAWRPAKPPSPPKLPGWHPPAAAAAQPKPQPAAAAGGARNTGGPGSPVSPGAKRGLRVVAEEAALLPAAGAGAGQADTSSPQDQTKRLGPPPAWRLPEQQQQQQQQQQQLGAAAPTGRQRGSSGGGEAEEAEAASHQGGRGGRPHLWTQARRCP